MDEVLRPRRMDLSMSNDPAAVYQRIATMERLLERSFVIPGIRQPIGFDAIAGLIPIAGDLIAAALGTYIIWEARNLGMPKWKLWRMAGNVAFDTAIGMIPVVGDLLDFLFRSNTRNLKIVKKHMARHHPLIEQ